MIAVNNAPSETLNVPTRERLFAQRIVRKAKGQDAPAQSIGLTEFKKSLWPKYRHWAHLNIIDQHLEQVAEYLQTNGERGIGRLMIFCPPQYGKSTTTSQYFPAWILGQMPQTRIIMSSYGDGLAKRNGREARKIVQSRKFQEHFPGVKLDKTKRNAKEWDIEGTGGGVVSAGVGGAVTGNTANLLLIDDPIRGRADAESPTIRQKVFEHWANDLYTRLGMPGAIVLMMTRWNFDDLAGRLMEDDSEKWTVLNLPAIAEENDPMGREIGRALWPEKHDEERLKRIRLTMGDYNFSALFQQTPQKTKGRLFDTGQIEIVDKTPEIVRAVRFYDLAVTAKARASWTAGVLMGITKDEKFIILHVYREQQELPDIHEGIVQNALIDGVGVPIRLEAEKGGIVELQFMLRDPKLRGFTMDAKPPIGDKYTRAGPFASRVNTGRVMMVKGVWNREYKDELAMFPVGSDADQVDASSGAFQMLVDEAPIMSMQKNPFFK